VPNGCPAPECHEQLVGIKRTLYGENGKGGVVGCLKDKVPKKWVWALLAISIVPAGSFTASVYYKTRASDLMYASKPVVAELSSRIGLLEYKDQEIRSILKRIEINQREMQQDIKKLLEERNR